MQRLHSSEFNLRQNLESAEEQIVESSSFFLTLRNWEYLGILLNFVQMAMLTFTFTVDSPFPLAQYALVAFPLWYAFELVNRGRILSSQSTKGYIYNLFGCPERPRYVFMHKVDAALTSVSLFCTVLCLGFSSRPLDLFANASVWRIFVVHPSFRNILFICSQGVAPLRMFLALAAIVYYYFCLLFYELCERAQENKGNHNFDTLRGTMITMYQVMLGIRASPHDGCTL